MNRARAALGRLKLRHRARAFAGAAAQVDRPGRLVAREAVFYPLRPVASLLARARGTDVATAWTTLTRGGRNRAAYRLRGSGRTVVVRHGTPDVYMLWEVLGRRVYEIPAPARAALQAAGRPVHLVDLGANIGLFEAFLDGRLPVGEVVAYEPDPANLAMLRRNAEADRTGAAWRVVPAAALDRDGELPFATGRFAESRVPEAGGPPPSTTVPARDVFADLDDADLLKVDIEGGEWPILADPRLAGTPVRALALEYHRWGCPGADPGQLATSLLERAGFVVGPAEEDAPGFGVLWAWRAPA
jgi:FkbM family methyltransferase